jgi:hypothetical protein
MECFLDNLKKNINLEENLYQIIKNIIVSENYAFKFENFQKFLESNKSSMKSSNKAELEKNKYLILFLFLCDIHKEFKNDLLSLLKEKNDRDIIIKISNTFLEILNFTHVLNKDLQEKLSYQRAKLKIFINFYEFNKFVLLNENNEISNLLNIYFTKIIEEDLPKHLKNVNEDIYQFLILFFKYFYLFNKHLLTSSYVCEETYLTKNIINLKNSLFEGKNHFDISLFKKDLQFNFCNCLFLLYIIYDKENFIGGCLEVLQHFEEEPYNLFTYIKAMLINLTTIEELFDVVYVIKYSFFRNFFNNYVINNEQNPIFGGAISILELYEIFLVNDFKANFTNLLNQIFVVIIQKLNHFIHSEKDKVTSHQEILINRLIKCFESNNFFGKVFEKMQRDKIHFNIMDDDYYLIIENFSKLSTKCQNIIENSSKQYLNKLLTMKQRFLIIEARLFKFLNFENVENMKLMEDFFIFLFNKKYDKKNLPLISEYIKILFEYYFSSIDNSNCVENNKTLSEKYKNILKIFATPFFKYMSKVDTKDLKFFNNLLSNLEKYNKNLYSVIVNEYHSINILSNEINTSVEQNYAIFLTLLKPYKNHKRTVSINEVEIIFKSTIIPDELEINFSIKLETLYQMVKSIDRFLVIYLIEFLYGLDEPAKIFKIIQTLLKYNIKTSYIEFKSSIMKVLIVYFAEYIERIGRLINKKKITKEEFQFLNISYEQFSYLFKFINNNIYDRPVENLLIYLELLKHLVECFQKYVFKEYKNEKVKESLDLFAKFKVALDSEVYERGLCISLISLLKHSWFFVRNNAFLILKDENFKAVLDNDKPAIIREIKQSLYSLRQMEAEGAVNLFILMLIQIGNSFIQDCFDGDFSNLQTYFSGNSILVTTLINLNYIKNKSKNYFSYLNDMEEISNAEQESQLYIHSHFIFIKNLLEEENSLPWLLSSKNQERELYSYSNFLLEVCQEILILNSEFSKRLLNNGVTESEFDDADYEDKGMISLWCSAKYSIESLSLCLDIINKNYKIISSHEKFINTLDQLLVISHKISNLMVEYKHMGAIVLLNESLLKVCRILNKSEENYKSFREETEKKLFDFIERGLSKEEVCSTLRRSAGIPFLIATLIKSFQSNEKLSNFSHNKVVSILKSSIECLLNNYQKYIQTNSDASVHCLHILRVIVDDTQLKPFARPFYDFIILKIVDGLTLDNWSVKNACMLLFSKIIKNTFIQIGSTDKGTPSFIEFFNNKDALKNKLFEKMRNLQNNDCNDCLILLVSLFSKFKLSKNAEINEDSLKEFIQILYTLSNINNKIFRKLLAGSLIKAYGNCYMNSLSQIEQYFSSSNSITNNQFDFIFNFLNLLILSYPDTANIIKETIFKHIKEIVQNQENNFFLKNKIIKFLRKVQLTFEDKENVFGNDLKFTIMKKENNVHDLEVLFNNLQKKCKTPFFNKYIKNLFLFFYNNNNTPQFSKFSFNLILPSNEEFCNYLFKKYPALLFHNELSLIKEIKENNILSSLNVNLATKILDYVETLFYRNSELCDLNFLTTLINLMENKQSITKLIKRLLKLISNSLRIALKADSYNVETNYNEIFIKILENIHHYVSSENSEEVRFSACESFEIIISVLNYGASIQNLSKILKIFILILNDEHPEIRNFACKQFTQFVMKNELINLKQNNSLLITYSNEYLTKRLIGMISNPILIKQSDVLSSLIIFFQYLLSENIYFIQEKIKINSLNKVFFFEPDNRYIDNVEIKLILLKQLWKIKDQDFIPQLLILLPKDSTFKINFMPMLEHFTQFIRNNFINFYSQFEIKNTEELEMTFKRIRKYIY